MPEDSDEQCAELLRAVGEKIDAGNRVGPRLLALASAPVLSPQQRSRDLVALVGEFYRSATTAPAECLGLTDDLGGITVGRRADLLLLNSDPLASIPSMQSKESALFGGRVFDRRDLDARLREAELRASPH